MLRTNNWKRLLGVILVTLLFAACDQLPAAQKRALKGTATRTPFQFQSTYTPTKEPAPTHTSSFTPSSTSSFTSTPEVSISPTITETSGTQSFTLTPSILPPTATTVKATANPTQEYSVQVSLTTNCRTGPGVAYAKLTPLQPGLTATLIGRDISYTYWIIKDPGKSGRDCWLWGYYATTTGDVSKLPVYYPPTQPDQPSTSTPRPTLPTTIPPATKTPRPSNTPKTPLPTFTPNLTPATITNTPLPPSETPLPSDTPLPSSTPPSKYCSYTSSLPGEEQQIMDMINNARKNHGLPELTKKNKLVTIAREHGQDLSCNGISGHDSSDGTKAWERIGLAIAGNKDWCYSHCCCGEIWSGFGSPSSTFDWWMNHEPVYKDGLNIHAWTILGKYYTRMGVGVTYYHNPNTGQTRKIYVVDFSSK